MRKVLILIFSLFLLFVQGHVYANDEFNWDEEIIYFILTDRFNDGDKSINGVYGDESYDINHLEAFHGGDFQGIIDKIDYLKELGITTLWITPIVKNIETNMRESLSDKQYGYHGYWAEDFTSIDPNLGSIEKLKELIDLLHENNIKLMVDVVLNHTGYGMNDSEVFKDMIRKDPGGGDLTSELAGLPDFRTEEKEVRDKIIKWHVDWLSKLRTDKGNSIDYFRVDTVKHVDHETWKDFKSELLKVNPKFKLIGENFGASISQNGGYLDPSMMDSLLDFEFKDIAYAFTKGRFEEIDKKLSYRNDLLNESTQMGQFLSSHDENGFLKMRLNGNVDLFKPVASLQLFSKGQVVIYSGEEIGMSGKKDDFSKGVYSENRKSFDWELVKDNQLLEHYKKIIQIRRDYKDVFSKGDWQARAMNENVYGFEREFQGKRVLVLLNRSDKMEKLLVDEYSGEKFVDIYNLQEVGKGDVNLNISVPANKDGGTAVVISESILNPNYKIQRVNRVHFMIIFGIVLVGFVTIVSIYWKYYFADKNKR